MACLQTAAFVAQQESETSFFKQEIVERASMAAKRFTKKFSPKEVEEIKKQKEEEEEDIRKSSSSA